MFQPSTHDGGPLRWLTVDLAADALRSYTDALGYPSPGAALDALARAVSVSAEADGPVRAVRAVRRSPPRLALLVAPGAGAEAGISAQAKALESACRQLRFVGYRAADAIAGRLADRLKRRFGDVLRHYELTAIPRGGWLVAGLVGRHLRWPPAAAGTRPAGTLIVDDCSLTGIALRRFARQFGKRQLIFAPLLAPRRLAREIERRAAGVRAVVVGAELAELGEPSSPEHEKWRRSWRARMIEPPYWFGVTEFACFPWNESKRWIWNPARESAERGWQLLARERCLDAHRGAPPATPVPGAFRLGGEVVAAEADGAVYVGDLRSGGSWRLDGPGAILWQALTSHGDRGRALTAVTERFDVDNRTAARDLDYWLADLTSRGLLEGD